MKKILTLIAAVLFAAGMFAQSYGILVNGTTYFAGTLVDENEGFTQYLAHVPVQNGDHLQLCDFDKKVTWAVPLNTYSVEGFTLNGEQYEASVEGCFDFYIKLKYEQDQLYIGPGLDCGEGVPYSGGDNPGGGGEGGGTGVFSGKDFFLKGYFNGKDIETPTADEQFEGGILTYTFTGDANGKGYFFILVCEAGQVIGDCYMAEQYTEATHCTLLAPGKGAEQKMGVPEGTVTFYLYDNGDGTLELSTEELPGKTLVGGGTEAVENTTVSEKAHKVIINGQLRIVRGDKVFDVTGRQL